MSTRDLIELVTVLSGVIVSVLGAIQQIRARKAGDADLAAAAGVEALARSKAAQGMSYDPSYLAVAQEVAAARRLLGEHGMVATPAPGGGTEAGGVR